MSQEILGEVRLEVDQSATALRKARILYVHVRFCRSASSFQGMMLHLLVAFVQDVAGMLEPGPQL